jgi:hypothetical protein
MQYGWRVTKYDPQLRDPTGAYRGDTWISVDDIGQIFGGERLTRELYLAIEDRYVASVLHFLNGSGLEALRVTTLEQWARGEKSLGTPELAALLHTVQVEEGQYISGDAKESICRLNLRSLLWCKLEEPGRFYLHFGYDYYMYLGADKPLPYSETFSRDLGLFVEPMRSPYC